MGRIVMTINGYVMELGMNGCGKCGGFVQDEFIIHDGESWNQYRCVMCSEISYLDWQPSAVTHRWVRPKGCPTISACPTVDLLNCEVRDLARRYECSEGAIYDERGRRGIRARPGPKLSHTGIIARGRV